MKPYKMKAPNCALFSVAQAVCYIFPWKIIIVPEILLRIYVAINQSKYRLRSCTTGTIARGRGHEANIALGLPRAILASRPRPCAILPVVHSQRYFN